ncbi:MAG: thioredoxin family protein [Phycisphaerales bacterium]|nr:MAG: thioredoxin family protein [Phycisphaerales bacterium]
MTVSYDPDLVTHEKLAQVITQDRFRATIRESVARCSPATAARQIQAPVPEDAPESFISTFEKARADRRPMLIAFGAKWCPACQRLEEQTLSNPEVVEALSGVQFIRVDLDESPDLGHWYGVSAVPHIVFIDRDGFIVDSVHNFEPPDVFVGHVGSLFSG